MGCISSTKRKTSQGKLEEPNIGVFRRSKKGVVARGYPIPPKGSALLVSETYPLVVPEADPLRDEVTNAALALYDAIESLSEKQVKYNLSQNEELLMDFVHKLIALRKQPGNENYDLIRMRTHSEYSLGDYIRTNDGTELDKLFPQPAYNVLMNYIPNRIEKVLQEDRNIKTI